MGCSGVHQSVELLVEDPRPDVCISLDAFNYYFQHLLQVLYSLDVTVYFETIPFFLSTWDPFLVFTLHFQIDFLQIPVQTFSISWIEDSELGVWVDSFTGYEADSVVSDSQHEHKQPFSFVLSEFLTNILNFVCSLRSNQKLIEWKFKIYKLDERTLVISLNVGQFRVVF